MAIEGRISTSVPLSGPPPAGAEGLGVVEVGDGEDRNREFKYYRMTPAGKKQLVIEESKWKQLAGAIARGMWPAEES